MLLFFGFFFFLLNESNKEVFTKREVYELQNKFLEPMFYFVMISSSTMSMRELLLQFFFVLVIHGFGTL
jgi:hypothetical protein